MMSRHPACSSLQSDHLIEMEPDKGFTAVLTPQHCHHSHWSQESQQSQESQESEIHQSWLCNLLGNFLHLHQRKENPVHFTCQSVSLSLPSLVCLIDASYLIFIIARSPEI